MKVKEFLQYFRTDGYFKTPIIVNKCNGIHEPVVTLYKNASPEDLEGLGDLTFAGICLHKDSILFVVKD